jgi:hypothetical protein
VREFGVHPTLMWFRNVVRWELKSTAEKIFSPLTVPVDVAMNLTMTTEEPGRCARPPTHVPGLRSRIALTGEPITRGPALETDTQLLAYPTTLLQLLVLGHGSLSPAQGRCARSSD